MQVDVVVAVVGSGSVGKSCLTIQFIQNVFVEEYDPTIEDSHIGHSRTRRLLGFLLIYSIIDRKTFDEISYFRDQILRVKDKTKFPVVLVGNKCDLADERKVTVAEGEALAKKWGAPFFESSAKMRVNIDEVFQSLLREVKNYQQENAPTTPKKKRLLCTII